MIRKPKGLVYLALLVFLNLSVYSQEDNTTYRSIEATAGQEGKVVKLELTNSYFYSIPEGVFNLVNLKSLNLSNEEPVAYSQQVPRNSGDSDFPRSGLIELDKEIIKLSNLEEINLNGNPNLDFQQVFEVISSLPRLKILAIMNNGIKDLPPNIQELVTLEQIWLGRNNGLNIQPTLEKLGQLPNLKHLGFGGMGIGKISFDSNSFQRLENLWLAGNNISSLDGLENLKSLKSITLNNNNLKKLPRQIANAQSLEYVGLNNNPELDFQQAIEDLSMLPQLRGISISNNNLKSIKGVEKLKSIEFLVVKGNSIPPAELTSFRESNPTVKVITE